MKITTSLALCALLLSAPAGALLTGCGGGGGAGLGLPSVPDPGGTVPTLAQIAGNYQAVITQTSGDTASGKGNSQTFNVTIDGSGNVSGTNSNDTFSGKIDAATGKFTLTASGTPGVQATAIFRLNNGVITGTGGYYDPTGDNNDKPANGTLNFTRVS